MSLGTPGPIEPYGRQDPGEGEIGMVSMFRKMFQILTRRERWSFLVLMVLVTGMATLDVLGVASIMPFLTLAANPNVITTNRWLAMAYKMSGVDGVTAFLTLLGGVSLGLLVFGNAYKVLTTWLLLRFIQMRNHSLARRMLLGYMRQPYAFFLDRSSSDLGKNVLQETGTVVSGVLTPCMDIISRLVVAVALALFLFLVDPVLALFMLTVVGSTYATIFALVRRKLGKAGEIRSWSMRQRFKVASEALQGIKDIRILGREAYFLERFSRASKQLAEGMAFSQVISQVPRFAMETVAFGGLMVIVMYSLVVSGNQAAELLPMIGLYAFAGFRLMPAMQQIFNGVSVLRYHQSALQLLLEDMERLGQEALESPLDAKAAAKLPFEKDIELDDVFFSYDGAKDVLKGLSLEVAKNTTVGIAGSTGAGKTTLVDLLLGLVEPVGGTVRVDGKPLTKENLRNWQRNIGYVPQVIFLCDDTMAANIAFGVSEDAIDMDAVVRAAKIASLHEFITQDLPQGYATNIGERGIRLSGGQRQRIGIARALYHDPDVLVFDEATSSLDGLTEAAVMQSIDSLARKKTIIMIAHRLSTLRNCDEVFVLESGRVAEKGRYDDLISIGSRFAVMATQHKE